MKRLLYLASIFSLLTLTSFYIQGCGGDSDDEEEDEASSEAAADASDAGDGSTSLFWNYF